MALVGKKLRERDSGTGLDCGANEGMSDCAVWCGAL
jgi:hypothetical protein